MNPWRESDSASRNDTEAVKRHQEPKVLFQARRFTKTPRLLDVIPEGNPFSHRSVLSGKRFRFAE